MPFKVTGYERMAATVRGIAKQFHNEVGGALYQEAQVDMTEAKARTPVWNPERPVPHGHTPGSLRASGRVHEPEFKGNDVTVALSFGNEIVDYAVYVHEDEEAFHATGQAHFLSSVLHESAPHMAARLAHRIQMRAA